MGFFFFEKIDIDFSWLQNLTCAINRDNLFWWWLCIGAPFSNTFYHQKPLLTPPKIQKVVIDERNSCNCEMCQAENGSEKYGHPLIGQSKRVLKIIVYCSLPCMWCQSREAVLRSQQSSSMSHHQRWFSWYIKLVNVAHWNGHAY